MVWTPVNNKCEWLGAGRAGLEGPGPRAVLGPQFCPPTSASPLPSLGIPVLGRCACNRALGARPGAPAGMRQPLSSGAASGPSLPLGCTSVLLPRQRAQDALAGVCGGGLVPLLPGTLTITPLPILCSLRDLLLPAPPHQRPDRQAGRLHREQRWVRAPRAGWQVGEAEHAAQV